MIPPGAEARSCRGTPAEVMDREGLAGTTWGNEMADDVWMDEAGTSWGTDRGTNFAGTVDFT